MAYNDAMDSGAVKTSEDAEPVQTPDAKSFWIPGDLLGGNCKKGDRYTVEATADPDEDGDVPVKLVSSTDAGSGESSGEDDMRIAFAEKT